MRRVLWKRFFEKLAEDSAFIEWLPLVLKRGNETARVEVQQRLGLVIRVDFNVLVLDTFLLEGDPYALHKRAEPARVELQRTLSRVCLGKVRGCIVMVMCLIHLP